MHGRLKIKTSKEQHEEQQLRDREKADRFQNLTKQIFELRSTISDGQELDTIFKLSNELLLINPDFYTVWNIRKEAILQLVSKDPGNSESTWRDELTFTIACLKQNEKSYSVWQHRIWVLSNMPESEYQFELKLCDSFLQKDERNFHCWDYRNYISELAQSPIEDEMEFTTAKIRSNFSNFSAWHRRHKLFLKGLTLPEGKCPEKCNIKLMWNEEYDLILNALFTDPSDQSAWLYHDWLIKNNHGKLRQEHVKTLEELMIMEPTNSYVKRGYELASNTVS